MFQKQKSSCGFQRYNAACGLMAYRGMLAIAAESSKCNSSNLAGFRQISYAAVAAEDGRSRS